MQIGFTTQHPLKVCNPNSICLVHLTAGHWIEERTSNTCVDLHVCVDHQVCPLAQYKGSDLVMNFQSDY